MGTIISKICCIRRHEPPPQPSSPTMLFPDFNYTNEKWSYSEDCCTL